ncbi:hypothetical protein ABTX80_24995 [Streptomyces erythrochromogenes]|uniref:hypothetical protein n=1 Tax=Streptomyces erythrochromogenes TaxID=285574 RepID=UPI0033264DDB
MPLTIGRWRIDRYEKTLYLQRQPDPKCSKCRGHGSVEVTPADHDRLIEAVIEPCDCWDPFANIRIPIGRTVITERYPF